MTKTKEEKSAYRREYYIKNKEKELKQSANYYKNNRDSILERQIAYNKEHAEERNAYSKQHYKNHPEVYLQRNLLRQRNEDYVNKSFNYNLKYKFNISREIYDQKLVAQDYKCEICKCTQNEAFCVDYCNTNGTIRGLLCSKCNIALRKFKDNNILMNKAINYLKDKQTWDKIKLIIENNKEKPRSIAWNSYRKKRDNRLKNLYGISLWDYFQILQLNKNNCFICNIHRNQEYGVFHVDYCHNNNVVRGLLCHSCNLGISQFKHDPILIKKAINYLEKYNARPIN